MIPPGTAGNQLLTRDPQRFWKSNFTSLGSGLHPGRFRLSKRMSRLLLGVPTTHPVFVGGSAIPWPSGSPLVTITSFFADNPITASSASGTIPAWQAFFAQRGADYVSNAAYRNNVKAEILSAQHPGPGHITGSWAPLALSPTLSYEAGAGNSGCGRFMSTCLGVASLAEIERGIRLQP